MQLLYRLLRLVAGRCLALLDEYGNGMLGKSLRKSLLDPRFDFQRKGVVPLGKAQRHDDLFAVGSNALHIASAHDVHPRLGMHNNRQQFVDFGLHGAFLQKG